MANSPTIALCIPAYNAVNYLPSLLNSALKQEVPFNEILVYDDCSTDNTATLAADLGATVVIGDTNRGCSFGKNKLAAMAKSDWLHFHDADDLLLPNFGRLAKKWSSSINCPDVVLLNYNYVDYKTNDLILTADYNAAELKEDPIKFVIMNKIVNFAICNRKRFLEIGGFDLDEQVLYNEDRAFYCRAIGQNLSFGYEPEVSCINYRYSESMSVSNLLKCVYAHYHVSLKLARRFGNRYPKEIANCFLQNATIAASCKDWSLTMKNIDAAKALYKGLPNYENRLFQLIYAINPLMAYKIREFNIRIFKRHLRT